MTETLHKPSHPVSIAFAVLLIAGLAGVVLAGAFDWLDRDLTRRLACIVFGLMLLGAGNILPKIVMPVRSGRAYPGMRRADRLAGAIFVLAGLACVGVAVFAPADGILLIESVIGIGTFMVAGLIWSGAALAAPRAETADTEQSPETARAKVQRLSVFLILNGLFWAFLIFVADIVWGDAGAQWMLVPFIIVNSLLAVTQIKLFRGLKS
ncbi:hypothetical protein [Hyphobacterium marinum]|uniref:Uncharacterized protein n=1 Tax=Hyphobacterium marinum TaxID=3116574 RepID=A0ABU7LWZ2_9PROT|nr:hypothetical protein [Hyphobacterium sp. Y6023]MEE2565515.1 hypothetical protein [Hyphobacterium sp. Y6023]